MTKNEKDLLLKDLCARVPYGVWIEAKLKDCPFSAKCMLNTRNAGDITLIEIGQYDFYKPYLFPLSSMTEEQECQYREVIASSLNHYEVYDWLNANHLDYRGLIEKSLALDATNLGIYE